MKKNESIYRLLSDLPRVADRKQAEPAPARRAEPDDTDLFYEEMKTVRALERETNRVLPRADKARGSVSTGPDPEKQIREAVEELPFCVPNLPEYMEGHGEDINPLVMEKLRIGEFSVQKVLDLHGYSVADAYSLFQGFIRESVSAGLNCVKIIHGRGLKSRRGPVLKEKLKEWIVRAMHRKWIAAFSSPKMSEGGPGATIVLLRRTPEKRRIHIAG